MAGWTDNYPEMARQLHAGLLTPLRYQRRMSFNNMLNISLTSWRTFRIPYHSTYPYSMDLLGDRLAVLFDCGDTTIYDVAYCLQANPSKPYYKVLKSRTKSVSNRGKREIGIYSSIKWKPGDGVLYSMSYNDNFLRIVETETVEELEKMYIQGSREIFHHVWSPRESAIIAVASDAHKLCLCDLRTGVVNLSFGRTKRQTYTAAWAPCEEYTLLGCNHQNVKFWDTRNPSRPKRTLDLPTKSADMTRMAPELLITPDNEKIITCTGEKVLRSWNYQTGRLVQRTRGAVLQKPTHSRWAFHICKDSSPPVLFVPFTNEVVAINANTLQRVKPIGNVPFPVYQVTFNSRSWELFALGDYVQPIVWRVKYTDSVPC